LDSQEQAFMQQVFPQVRVAASFDHPNWASIGYPDGPPLSPVSYAAVRYVWPQIRVAADWSHPRWDLHPVPWNILAAAMPAPEAPPPPTSTPTFTPATPAPAVPSGPTEPSFTTTVPASGGGGGGGGSYYSPPIYNEPIPEDALEEGAAPGPIQAGMFGGLSLPMILTAAGAILFFSLARGARSVRVPKRRRRR
jgi:hypothetical protein